MPRVSKAEAERHRVTIEEVSSRLFREQGFHGISVADLMGAAGLTHGGFYGHFASKDALAAIACTRAFEESGARWRKRVEESPDKATALAAQPVPAALANDVAREGEEKPVRAAFVDGIRDLLEILEGVQPGDDPAARRAAAIAQMSTMVGALVLSRATLGTGLSNEVLAAAKAQLLAQVGDADGVSRGPTG